MRVIRHICDGHEYRYDTITGEVKNNYGQPVTHLAICRFSGIALLYAHTPHWPVIRAGEDLPLAFRRGSATDAQLAEFAIGHTAANLPEPR